MFGFTHEQKTECKNSGTELCIERIEGNEYIKKYENTVVKSTT